MVSHLSTLWTESMGGSSLCSVLAQLSEKAEPLTTSSDSLACPPRHLTCIKWKVNWKNGQELLPGLNASIGT